MPDTNSPPVGHPDVDKEELRRTIAEILDVDESLVTDEAEFAELGVDSLLALEIVVGLERRYEVKLDEPMLKEFSCLRAAHDLLSRLVTS